MDVVMGLPEYNGSIFPSETETESIWSYMEQKILMSQMNSMPFSYSLECNFVTIIKSAAL